MVDVLLDVLLIDSSGHRAAAASLIHTHDLVHHHLDHGVFTLIRNVPFHPQVRLVVLGMNLFPQVPFFAESQRVRYSVEDLLGSDVAFLPVLRVRHRHLEGPERSLGD
jgi:hypothetical protein